MKSASENVNWLSAIRRYLAAVAAANLLWEFAQMPLYTLGQTGSAKEIVLAALLAALVVFGNAGWPEDRFWLVAITAVTVGSGYTVFSEYLNTVVRHSWTYSSMMPTLPWLGTGWAPLAQWLFIPAVALMRATSRTGLRPSHR